MATITSLYSLGSKSRAIRNKLRVLCSALPADYIVREILLENERIAPLLIEGPNNGWAFAEFSEQEPAADTWQRLENYNAWRCAEGAAAVNYLLISPHSNDLFAQQPAVPNLLRLGLDSTPAQAAEIIQTALTLMDEEQHNQFKSRFVAESVVITKKEGKRLRNSSNSPASLGNFFLDYDQEQAVKLNFLHTNNLSLSKQQDDYNLSLINGVAGSGKTLILMNRALLYHKNNPTKKFIILIHNRPVVQWVRTMLQPHIAKAEHCVQPFHSFALFQNTRVNGGYLDNVRYNLQVADIHQVDEQLKLDKHKIAEEIDYINDYLIADKEQYLEYDRQGRGFALQKSQRSLIWQLYEEVSERMKIGNSYGNPPLASLYIRNLCFQSNQARLFKYDHILIDEAQFFAPSWLQLVKMSLKPKGEIFMCADPNQGFLKHRLSWRSIGLNVQNRTQRLQRPYRSTYEIITAASRLLSMIQEEDDDYLKPQLVSVTRGQKPRVIYSSSPADENRLFIRALSSLLQQHDSVRLEHIVVLTSGYSSNVQRLIEQQLGHGISLDVNSQQHRNADPGNKIRVMSINSCTGIEAPVVLILGTGELIKSYNDLRLDDAERQQVMQEPIRKLYVAMTRAAQKLVIFSTEPLPDILAEYVETNHDSPKIPGLASRPIG